VPVAAIFATQQQEEENLMKTNFALVAYTSGCNRHGQQVLTRIGAAWPFVTQRGYYVELDAQPINRRLVLLEALPGDTTPPDDLFF
jgi:hypothetical protein